MSAFKTATTVVVSTLAGMLAGGVAATLYFAAVNSTAADGPYFAPALAALAVVVPVALVLLPFQLAILVWRGRKRTLSLRAGLVIGAISGLVAGFVVAFAVFASSQQTAGDVLGFAFIGVVQGCATMFWLGRMVRLETGDRECTDSR